MNKIIGYTSDGKKVGIVSNEIETKLQAKLKLENELKVKVILDSINIFKMSCIQEKEWANMHINTVQFEQKSFKEKFDFLKKYEL